MTTRDETEPEVKRPRRAEPPRNDDEDELQLALALSLSEAEAATAL